jgi:hypothetical protein
MQSVISTHTSLVLTLTSVIPTRSSMIYTHRVEFLHAEFNFNMHECDLNTLKIGFYFYTQSVVSTHTRVILTRMRVNMTLLSVTTRTTVIYTRRV